MAVEDPNPGGLVARVWAEVIKGHCKTNCRGKGDRQIAGLTVPPGEGRGFTNLGQSINFVTLAAEAALLRRSFVAHSLSAKKRIRQSIKRRARNRARKEVLKDQVKVYLTALASNDLTKASEELRKTVIRLDKEAAKNTIHKNTAARRRSRLTKRLNAAKAAQASSKGKKV
jgi:small subunit ribosomal protein S20